MKAIYGQKFAPGFADWYLGKTGYGAQQTKEPVDPHRPDNLFEPVSGNYAAHGNFDSRSSNFSLQTWITLHRRLLTICGLGAAGAILAASREQT